MSGHGKHGKHGKQDNPYRTTVSEGTENRNLGQKPSSLHTGWQADLYNMPRRPTNNADIGDNGGASSSPSRINTDNNSFRTTVSDGNTSDTENSNPNQERRSSQSPLDYETARGGVHTNNSDTNSGYNAERLPRLTRTDTMASRLSGLSIAPPKYSSEDSEDWVKVPYESASNPENANSNTIPRDKATVEEKLGDAWKDSEVQGAFVRLRQETPGTQKWHDQSTKVSRAYLGKLLERKETGIMEKLNELDNMLKPGGYIYNMIQAQRQKKSRDAHSTANINVGGKGKASSSQWGPGNPFGALFSLQERLKAKKALSPDSQSHTNNTNDYQQVPEQSWNSDLNQTNPKQWEKTNTASSQTADQSLPARDKATVEELLGKAWESQVVQDALAQLRQETPGTQEWNDQSAEVLKAYRKEMTAHDEEEVVAKSNKLSEMLKAGGEIYEEVMQAQRQSRQQEIPSQDPAPDTSTSYLSDYERNWTNNDFLPNFVQYMNTGRTYVPGIDIGGGATVISGNVTVNGQRIPPGIYRGDDSAFNQNRNDAGTGDKQSRSNTYFGDNIKFQSNEPFKNVSDIGSGNEFLDGTSFKNVNNIGRDNTFGANCHLKAVSNIGRDNTFGADCHLKAVSDIGCDNTFGANCHLKAVSDIGRDNTFGANCCLENVSNIGRGCRFGDGVRFVGPRPSVGRDCIFEGSIFLNDKPVTKEKLMENSGTGGISTGGGGVSIGGTRVGESLNIIGNRVFVNGQEVPPNSIPGLHIGPYSHF
jgi:acetyltransferase-like isoleucine patch superfamily enzyme